jgi:hypothetical protein
VFDFTGERVHRVPILVLKGITVFTRGAAK